VRLIGTFLIFLTCSATSGSGHREGQSEP
jgi:hypothetical protein